MFIGKTRIVMLAVRVLEKFKSRLSKPIFEAASRGADISLTTKLAKLTAVNCLINKM